MSAIFQDKIEKIRHGERSEAIQSDRAGPGWLRYARHDGLNLFLSIAFLALAGCGPSGGDEPLTGGVPPEMRRLTEDQYRNAVGQIFGRDIVIGGQFDPTMRSNGLIAVGASVVTISPSAFEHYDYTARAIAAQVIDQNHRDQLIPCKPSDAKHADDACARQFLSEVGRLLYRRPLSDKELTREVGMAKASADSLGNFYAGLGSGLVALLETPPFLYVSDKVEPDPDHPGSYRLDAFSKAARLSFFLWNTAPDDALLTAAQKGELNSPAGLAKQVDRMIASPRLDEGVKAFFADMLSLDEIDTLRKDPVIYPVFASPVAEASREETLRTIADLLLVRKRDYRDLFTTRETFLTGPLGPLYQVPVENPENWIRYEYAPNESPERVGIQSQASFVALHSHPGSSSPTIRGRAIREIILCQKVPDPPSNVDFTLFSDEHNPVYKTARQRLQAHATAPACAGCHKLVDPIGLAMEHFDGAGEARITENDAPIDTSGELDGVKYNDAAGLGAALHDNPNTSACLVNRLYAYASGHTPAKNEAVWLNYTQKRFASDGYNFPALLRAIATSNALYAISAGKPPSSQRAAGANDTVKEKPL